MSDVGHVVIEPVARHARVTRHVRATVNVGGSLVQVDCDSDHDPELEELVGRLYARLADMALEAVHTSLHQSER